MARTLINVPAKAKRGEIITIRTLISHVMENGFRHTPMGVRIPRNIIDTFVCIYNGEEIFRAALHPAIAANPFITFHTIATTCWVSASRTRVDTLARPERGPR